MAVSPRVNLALSPESRAALEALGVTYVSEPLNNTGSAYGTINRIVAGAWAEANLPQPYLVVLDTDMFFVGEPRFLRKNVGVRPVDVKGSATSGADDPMDKYWARLCGFAKTELSQLPLLQTSVDHVPIRASYNGGFMVVRRDLGILQRTKDIFFASLAEDVRPLAGSGANIKASTGLVGFEASEWWGASQAALSIAIWSKTSDVHVYDSRYNIPAHIVVELPWPLHSGYEPVLLHYHYLLERKNHDLLYRAMRKLGCSLPVLDWIEEQLAGISHEVSRTTCLCTLAIHEPYRRRARLLCADAPDSPWVILTDEPADFADLQVRAVAHVATGPMALDFLQRIRPTGNNRGAAAYHDKRFALIAALERHNTAIYLDADSRIAKDPQFAAFPPGISVLPVVQRTVLEHLEIAGSWRRPAFVELAEHLTGNADILSQARWCQETCFAITKDGREAVFFETWRRAAEFMQARGVFSGEGGVIGLAAAIAGWTVDYNAVVDFGSTVSHEGGGPKEA